ncbi:MAG: hypothetical protein Q9204_006170 [Flavoplaca sp. TL-2023a]
MEPEIAALVLAYEADPAAFLEAQGNRQLDINVCPTFGACSADGLALWKELEQIKMTQRITIYRAVVQHSYRIIHTCLLVPTPGLAKTSRMTFVSSISAELGLGRWAYTNLFDTNAGAIVGVWNARDLDFKQSGPISNLKHSIQYQVDNPETIEILDTIYVNNKILARVDREWRVWTDDDPRTKNWFFGLVGTDSCRGTLELLKNHAVEIGRKDITEIRTRWWGEKPDIWAHADLSRELGRCGNLPTLQEGNLILQELRGFREEMRGMREEMREMREEMQGMREEMPPMREEIRETKALVTISNENSIARLHNSQLISPDQPLMPLRSVLQLSIFSVLLVALQPETPQ